MPKYYLERAATKPNISDYPLQIDSLMQSLSETVLLMADNQLTEELNAPIAEQSSEWLRNIIAGRSVYRHGVLSALSPEILHYILQKHQDKLVIHIGDALNNSCVSEYELFEKVMKERNWFLTPGNHDGYYLGVTLPTKKKEFQLFGFLNNPVGWCQVCRPYYKNKETKKSCAEIVENNKQHAYILNKSQFVGRYLETIGISSPTKVKVINNKKINFYEKPEHSDMRGRNKYLRKLAWHRSKEKPWESFIIQQLDVYSKINKNEKAFAVIILDTASYNSKPKISSCSGAAYTAEIIDAQKEIIGKWLCNSRVCDNLPVVLIGHHPLSDFTQSSIETIHEWYKTGFFDIYMSGDVHDGYLVKHKKIKRNDVPLTEVNLGSTLDAPIEYMTLSFLNNSTFKTQRYFMTPFKDKEHEEHKILKYGESDGIWEDCECLYGEYNSNKGEEIFISDNAKKINDILRKNPLRKSHYKFVLTKMRRYSEMLDIYQKIFIESNHEKKKEILDLIRLAIVLIDKQIKEGNADSAEVRLIKLSCYLDGKNFRINQNGDWEVIDLGLDSLPKMALFDIKSTPKTEKLKKLILCASLYAAEYDYDCKPFR